MSTVIQLPSKEELYDECGLWISKLDRGLTADEEIDLRNWLKSSKVHRDEFFEMAKQWDEMGVLSCLTDIFPRKPQRKLMPAAALAASVAFLMLAGVVALALFGEKSYEEMPDQYAVFSDGSELGRLDYETAIGEQSSVVLPDGSGVFLNTNTQVSVSYTETERLIRLERGELNVEVAHNPARPLKVVTGEHIVEAIGTAFNLQIMKNRALELVVTEGEVLVAQIEPQHTEAASTDALTTVSEESTPSISVSAGEEILLGSEDAALRQINPDDIAVKLSWRNGRLIFQGESLQTAMAEVARYTSTEFVFMDDATKDVRIAGRFKAGELDTLLGTLENNFNISYRFVSDSRVELSSL